MADVRTPELVINKLTKQQYENIQNPSDTEIYLVREDEEHKPICYSTTASDVKTTSMVVKSSVSDNGKILTENGFVYNTSGNPTVNDTKVICDLGAGFFEKKLENLTMNTEYHIKSYGQNASGLVYGSELVQRTTNSPIPVEYQLVEYLESSGIQYIDTLYKPSISNDIVVNAQFLTTSSTAQFFGCSIIGSYNLRCHFGSWNNALQLWIDTANTTISKPFNISFYEYKFTTALCYIDYISGVNNNAYPNLLNFYLFARNNNGVTSNFSNARVSRFYVENVGVKLIDMYPVYRKADNKPGMYDIVNGVFYTNQGTGEFVVGPDAVWNE